MTDQLTKGFHDWLERRPQGLTTDEAEILGLPLVQCHNLMGRIKQHVNAPKEKSKSVLRKSKYAWEDQSKQTAQPNAQQQLINIFSLSRDGRARARQHERRGSILSHTRESAAIYSSRDYRDEQRTEDDLANTDAYKIAFASLMKRSEEKKPEQSGANVTEPSTPGEDSPSRQLPRADSFQLPRVDSFHSPKKSSGALFQAHGSTKTKSSQLVMAASQGREEFVRTLLDSGAKVNYQDDSGRTALNHAAKGGHFNIVRLLLEHSARPDLADKEGHTPVFAAVIGNYEAIVRILLEYRSAPETKDKAGNTALHHAIYGNTSIVRLLLVNGAPVDARNDKGLTPLHLCVRSSLTSPITFLVQAGADTEATTRLGKHFKVVVKHVGMFEMNSRPVRYDYYNTMGSDSEHLDDKCLHMAIRNHDLNMVMALLGGNAHTESKTGDFLYVTPLRLATDLALKRHRALHSLNHPPTWKLYPRFRETKEETVASVRDLEAIIIALINHGANPRRVRGYGDNDRLEMLLKHRPGEPVLLQPYDVSEEIRSAWSVQDRTIGLAGQEQRTETPPEGNVLIGPGASPARDERPGDVD